MGDILREKRQKAASLAAIPGHPLETFGKENRALEALIEEADTAIAEGKVTLSLINRLRGVVVHYDKKGDLLYPHLKAAYNIVGPSDVLWTTDDEIRDELADMAKELSPNPDQEMEREASERLFEVLRRMESMIRVEEMTLFPNCAVNFKETEWYGIYQDSKDYDVCLGVVPAQWPEAEAYWKSVKDSQNQPEAESNSLPQSEEKSNRLSQADMLIRMPGGHLTVAQLTALLNTIPMEITFVDDRNINCFFNEGPKVFKRPNMAIDREVFTCHPPKVEEMVRRIFDEFRAGTLDRVPIWSEKGGKTILTTYYAVRDRRGNYLGTVELVQNMEEAKDYFAKKPVKEAQEN